MGRMANLKSSKKDVRRTEKRTVANAAQKSKVRTFYRKAKDAVAACKTYKEGMEAIVNYESVAMISTKNNLFSKKSVSRHVSALVKALKSRFDQNDQVCA